jgi:hypothetical protein
MMQIETMDRVIYMFDNNKDFWEGEYRSLALCGLTTRIQNPDSTVFPDCPIFVEAVGTPQQFNMFETLDGVKFKRR